MPGTPAALLDPLLAISDDLRPRDYVLAHLLEDHDILSLEQVQATLFTSARTCRHRLGELQQMRFIATTTQVTASRRRRTFVLPGLLSSRYVSLTKGEAEPSRKALRDRQGAAAFGAGRDDVVARNWFFVDLITHARTHPGAGLARWWSPTLTRAAVQGLAWPHGHGLHPDGHGVWIEDGREVRFFLEHDTGAGAVPDLMERIERHRQLRYDGGPDYPVLIWLSTREREADLHEHLQRATFGLTLAGLTVATASRDVGVGPASAQWWVTTDHAPGNRSADVGQERRHLRELPGDGPRGDEADASASWVDRQRSQIRQPEEVSNPVLLARTLLGPASVQQDPMYLPPWA
jgi:hypothetical protein